MTSSIDRQRERDRQGFCHLHLVVADVTRSAAFYDALGFRPRYVSAAGVVFLRGAAHDTLALEPATRCRPPGFDHVGFAVADGATRDTIVGRVVDAGGSVVERSAPGADHGHALVADPDGHLIRF
jgi:catechol 2,3-dioxygenase-like lactoylglutathione lyase family enzyme